MKLVSIAGVSLISMMLLTGCSTNGCSYGDCGYYTYNSVCGLPSCTDTTVIIENSNPCPGEYTCE